jgi:hypothetical protein
MRRKADRTTTTVALPSPTSIAITLLRSGLMFICGAFRAEWREVLFSGMFTGVSGVGEGSLVLVLMAVFFFDAEKDFLAHCGLEFECLMIRNWLPVADATGFDGFSLAACCEHNAGLVIVGVILCPWLDWLNSSCPDTSLVVSDTDNFPGHLRAYASDFLQYRAWCGTRRDEDVVREVLNLVVRAVGRELDQGFEFLDIRGRYEVAGIEDRALDPIWPRSTRSGTITYGLIVIVNHSLNFCYFGYWVHGAVLFVYLDNVCCERLAWKRASVERHHPHEA